MAIPANVDRPLHLLARVSLLKPPVAVAGPWYQMMPRQTGFERASAQLAAFALVFVVGFSHARWSFTMLICHPNAIAFYPASAQRATL